LDAEEKTIQKQSEIQTLEKAVERIKRQEEKSKNRQDNSLATNLVSFLEKNQKAAPKE
jgi:hypothetical protein